MRSLLMKGLDTIAGLRAGISFKELYGDLDNLNGYMLTEKHCFCGYGFAGCNTARTHMPWQAF